MKKIIVLLLSVMALLLVGNAYALSISPGDTIYTGTDNSQGSIDSYMATTYPAAVELYRSEVDGAVELYALSGSYETTYDNAPTDPSEATITYTGGDYIGPDAYLIVKDGNHLPAWYLFKLSADPGSLDWDGTETLELSGFWVDDPATVENEGQGAISHVSLYGSRSVPEPAGMFLLGTGLIGLAALGRRKFRN